METQIRFQAEAQIAELGERACYVLAGDGWHPGVIGIVASRLAERHRRPVVMIALDGELGKGSGRSIEAFDLLAGLTPAESISCATAATAPPRALRSSAIAWRHSRRQCAITLSACSRGVTWWPPSGWMPWSGAMSWG